jgi:hypothetical protein
MRPHLGDELYFALPITTCPLPTFGAKCRASQRFGRINM